MLLCPQWTMIWQVACHEPHASRVMLSKALIPCTTWSWYHEQSTFLQFQRNSLKNTGPILRHENRISRVKVLADYPGSFFINGTWRWEHLGYYRPCRHRLSNLLNALLKDSTSSARGFAWRLVRWPSRDRCTRPLWVAVGSTVQQVGVVDGYHSNSTDVSMSGGNRIVFATPMIPEVDKIEATGLHEFVLPAITCLMSR